MSSEEQKNVTVDSAEKNDYTATVVPLDKRKSFMSLAAVWFGWVVSISAFMTGGSIAKGSTASQGLLAVLAGNLVLVLIASFIGVLGQKTGLTTYSIARIVFGKKGSVISSVVLGVMAMGFIGVLLNSFGLAFNKLVPAIPVFAAVLIFAIPVTISTLYGFKGIAIVGYIALPLLLIMLAIGLVTTVNGVGGIDKIFAITPAEPIPFASAAGFAIATWIAGSALSADISRFAKKPSHVVGATLVGYVLGASIFEGGAVLTAIGTGNSDFVGILASVGLLVPGILILALALWTTMNSNIYSSSLAFTNMGELIGLKLSTKVWVIIGVIIAVAVSLLGLAAQFSVWLGFIGSMIPPFAGILIVHFWIINKGKDKLVMLKGFRLSAFITWIAGIVLARIFLANQASFPAIPASVLALVCSGIIYFILTKLMDKNVPEDAETMNIPVKI